MVKLGCTIDGVLNEAKFSEPLPWIGIYIAAASLLCAIAMAADAIHGFRYSKLWFPCKYFTINATSLTIITVAVKLSVDLNTPMPRGQDQLAKLSSTALICTVMGNSMPSLGTMENKELFTNTIALAILVITVIVNICIQLGTGVIYVFWMEHAIIMFLMLVLLVVLSFTALAVPTIKHYLELKYSKKYEIAKKECSITCETDKPVVEKLKEDLMKYWMMAHTCSPQFVMGRSVTCTASGALCLLSAATLAEAMLRYYLKPGSFTFCKGEPDYKWSIKLVLLTQAIAVGLGTIAPAMRWFLAINFRCPTRGRKKGHKRDYRLEVYWIKRLVEMKECPLDIGISNPHWRRIVHDAKVKFLNLCIGIQGGIIFTSKLIRLISTYFMFVVLSCYDQCRDCLMKFRPNNSITNDSGSSESASSSKLDLSRFVLYLEGEDTLVEVMMKENRDATDSWRQKANKRQPKHLIKLLELSRPSERFKGLIEFDSFKVPSLDIEEAPNSWALAVVTLTGIAVALPNVNSSSIKHLISGVNEGLMYVRHIEDNLDMQGNLTNMRKAAEVVWLGVELYHRWLDVDLRKLSLQGKTPKEILELLSDSSKNIFMEFKKNKVSCLLDSPSKWPVKVLAANCMYRICQSILLVYECRKYQSEERLCEAITVMISDILAACLTNLQQFISIKCSTSSIEVREESVRHAVYVLGKTEKILELLHRKELPGLSPGLMAHMDEWRSFHKLNSSFTEAPLSLSPESESDSRFRSEVYLTIE